MQIFDYSDRSLYEEACKHSYLNLNAIKQSEYAGCYYCLRYFITNVINEDDHCPASKIDGTQEPTVFCPLCGIDTVIGDATGYDIKNIEFLRYMNFFAFKT